MLLVHWLMTEQALCRGHKAFLTLLLTSELLTLPR